MSRSIHKTTRGVFGNIPKSQVDKMIEEEDPDFLELLQKLSYKVEGRNKRKAKKIRRNSHG